MFWGLIMEPQKRYSQIVKKAFHISMAALDISTSTEELCQVMCGFEGRKYLLCTLKKGEIIQCPLDLNFDVGDQVSFVTNGASHVHLTGYLNEDEMDNLESLMEEDLEEEEEEAVDVSLTNIVQGKRQKKAAPKEQPAAKKSKIMQMLDEANSHDEDDSDFTADLDAFSDDEDEDDDSDDEDASDGEQDEEVDEDAEEEEADDEENEDEEQEDEEVEDEEDDEEDSDEELEEVVPKSKQNGVVKSSKKPVVKEEEVTPGKKAKKQKQQQQQQTPAKKVEEKKTPLKGQKEGTPQKRTVEGGVIIEEIRVGNGQIAKPGKVVNVYYEGRLKNNNKVFDSTLKGTGFKFRLGKQEVIKGWDVGVQGMKVGGKRRITCPPNMAYGHKGSPPTIPTNSTLVFEVELKNVN